MSVNWRFRVGASLCALALASSCGDSGTSTAPGPTGDGDLTPGDGDATPGDSGTTPGDGDTSPGDGDGDGMLVGEYWMRTDLTAKLSQMTVGTGAVTITSAITAFSLVRVAQTASGYEMTDWQCQVKTVQQCDSTACSNPSSVVRDGEGRAFAPSKRTLTVDAGGSWNATACAAATGWKWNCATDAPHELPSMPTDPLVYDPAGGGAGVDLTVKVTVPVFGDQNCATHLVQLVDVLYSGSLQGGKLGTGVATDHGSKQRALDTGCGTPPDPVPVGPGTLRAIAAPKAITGGDAWDCPSLAEFEQALPNP